MRVRISGEVGLLISIAIQAGATYALRECLARFDDRAIEQ